MSLWNPVCSVLLWFSVRERLLDTRSGEFFSHRAHRVHWAFWRTFRAHKIVAPPPTPPPQGGAWYVRLPLLGCLCGAWGVFSFMLDIFSSHRTHRFYRIFLRTVSNSQNASGIQISQSVKTIVDTNKGQHKADILLIGVSRWSLPFPPGEWTGEGPLSHRTPPAYRKHRGLLLNLAMRFGKDESS